MENQFEVKSPIFSRNSLICLGIVGLAGFLIRFFYLPEGIPITFDGYTYFWYANDLSLSGTFPTDVFGVKITNNGWPTFLSVFFSLFNSDNFLHYMDLQRYVTITISVITIIPVFVLCRRFCGNGLSLLGTVFFVFQPRIIENSLLGITEPLFVLLAVSCLVLFLQDNLKLKYISFAFLALVCLVRYEGIVLILPLSFLFLFKNRKNKIIIPKFLLAISIFAVILLPMLFLRIDTIGHDGVLSHSADAVGSYTSGKKIIHVGESIFTLAKSVGLAVFPIFFIFAPLGIYGFFRHRSFDKYVVLLFLVFLSLPIIYTSIREITEPRFLFSLFPILSLFSIYTVKEIIGKFNQTKLILIIVGVTVLVLSIVFLEYTQIDYEHELEAYQIGFEVHKRTSVINEYLPETKYIHGKDDIFWNLEAFPILSSETERKVKAIRTYDYTTCINEKPKDRELTTGCREYDYTSLNEFVAFGREQGLTHIVTDGNLNRPQFLKDVFNNEEIPYLTKTYDSSANGYEYHVKIFSINYEKFESIGLD